MRIAILSLISMLLVSCAGTTTGPSSTPRETPRGQVSIPNENSVFELVRAAELAEPSEANRLRLRAAELALSAENPAQANNIVPTITLPVAADIEMRYALLRARLALVAGDGLEALTWLRKPVFSRQPLNNQKQIMLGELKANSFTAARSHLASARERIFLNPLLEGEAKRANQESIFASLLELQQSNLNEQANKAITSELRGWLSLAAMTKQYQNTPMRQLEALNQWQRVWSTHPAAVLPPLRLATLSSVVENQATSVALFLPLNGDLAPFGRAIRDAVIASRFQVGRDVDIQVYDSTNTDIGALLSSAVQAGAQLAIGPLDRTKVTTLASLELPIPVLALNRTLDGSANPNLYQFGLAPEDEMVQVADQVFREGKRNALIIYPDNAWGERNFNAFQNRWRGLGGNVINASAYGDQRDYSTMIKTLLDVDLSEGRANDLRRIIGQGFEFTPRRRQDIDFVFLLANQSQARGINPTLAFYYAEDIPVYSTSHVHEYSDSKIESIDLNGIRFCDIPWKLGDPDVSQQQLQALWPNAKSTLAPFYALGVDAFRLHPRLEQMKRLPTERIFGETGILQLDSRNVVNRKLAWAQFDDGEVIPAPQVVSALPTQ
jgi:outer membrane PBP1 activator LpoA protein